MSQRIHVVMPDELVQAIDAKLVKYQTRSDWIREAVERALALQPAAAGDPPAPAERPKKPKAAQDPPEPQDSPQKASQEPTGPYRQGYGPDVTRYRSSQQRTHHPRCDCPVCSGAVKG